MRLDDALILQRREVGDVLVVLRAESVENVVAAIVDRRQRKLAMRHVEESQLDRPRRNEALIDEDVHRIGVVDGEQLQLIGVGGLPQLLGELQDVSAVARLQRARREFAGTPATRRPARTRYRAAA